MPHSRHFAGIFVPRRKTSTSFKPGKSGNPAGRLKTEICLTDMLKAWVAEDEPGGKRTNGRVIVEALGKAAKEGKPAAIQQVFDRIDGLLQPILEGPAIDLETIALAMKAKLDQISRDSGGLPEEGSE
jgi:hypothetical protein